MSEFEVRDKEGFAAKLRSTLRHGLPNLQIKAPDDHSRTSSDGRTTKDGNRNSGSDGDGDGSSSEHDNGEGGNGTNTHSGQLRK